MSAGHGPKYPELPFDPAYSGGARWEYSNGLFVLGGAFVVTLQPSAGEAVGDPVKLR